MTKKRDHNSFNFEHFLACLRTYVYVQDLFNKFQSLVLPEAINYVLMEDESTVELLDELASFRLTSYPSLPLTEALAKLSEDLLQAAIKVRGIGRVRKGGRVRSGGWRRGGGRRRVDREGRGREGKGGRVRGCVTSFFCFEKSFVEIVLYFSLFYFPHSIF